MNVVKRGILIGSIVKLDSGLRGALIEINLNGIMALPTITNRVVKTF
jgi:hypothetical protein